MKKVIVILSFLGCTLSLLAQQVDISPEQTIRDNVTYEIIGKIKSKVLMYRSEGTEYEIQAYDTDMQKDWDEPLEFERKTIKSYGFSNTNSEFSLLYSYRRKGKMHIHARQYDGKAKLMRIDTLKTYERRAFMPDLKFIESQNKQLVLLYSIQKNKAMEAFVFDTRNRQILWDKVFTPADLKFREEFVDVFLDNKGNAHFVFEKDNKRLKKEKNRFEIFTYNRATETESITMLPLKNRLWSDVMFEYDNRNEKLIGAGLYADKLKSIAEGYFYLNIDLFQQEDRTLKFHKFTPDYIKTVLGKEKIKKSQAKGFIEIEVQEVVLRSDGGILLIVERTKEHSRDAANYQSSFNGRDNEMIQRVDYFYNDIMLFSVNPDGTPHWNQILHKRQYSQDDGGIYSSYFLLKTPKSLRFLYNDQIKRENIVNEYIVTGSVEPKRKNVLNTAGEKIMLMLREAEQVSSNEIIIPSEHRRELKLVKVSY